MHNETLFVAVCGRFENGKDGYSGHHTEKVVSDKGHAFEISIGTPHGKVFEGVGCFNLHRTMGFGATLPMSGNLGHKKAKKIKTTFVRLLIALKRAVEAACRQITRVVEDWGRIVFTRRA